MVGATNAPFKLASNNKNLFEMKTKVKEFLMACAIFLVWYLVMILILTF